MLAQGRAAGRYAFAGACSKYYHCQPGSARIMACPSGKLFKKKRCIRWAGWTGLQLDAGHMNPCMQPMGAHQMRKHTAQHLDLALQGKGCGLHPTPPDLIRHSVVPAAGTLRFTL